MSVWQYKWIIWGCWLRLIFKIPFLYKNRYVLQNSLLFSEGLWKICLFFIWLFCFWAQNPISIIEDALGFLCCFLISFFCELYFIMKKPMIFIDISVHRIQHEFFTYFLNCGNETDRSSHFS